MTIKNYKLTNPDLSRRLTRASIQFLDPVYFVTAYMFERIIFSRTSKSLRGAKQLFTNEFGVGGKWEEIEYKEEGKEG